MGITQPNGSVFVYELSDIDGWTVLLVVVCHIMFLGCVATKIVVFVDALIIIYS